MDIKTELDWFLSDETGPAGDLGMRSSFDAFQAQCMCGAGSGHDAIGSASAAHDRAIEAIPAAARYRAIADVFYRVSPEHRAILCALHAPLLPALRVCLTPRFGRLGGVVLVLAGRERAIALAEGPLDANQKARVDELLEQAEHARAAAWRAFNAAAAEQRATLAAQRAQKRDARIRSGVDSEARLEQILERLRGAA